MAPGHNDDERLAFALGQLDRLLNFFPRMEAKAAAVFAVDAAMLSAIALNFPYKDLNGGLAIPGAIAFVIASLSLVELLWVFTPYLKSPKSTSLIYFGGAADRDLVTFKTDMAAATVGHLLDDAVEQVWRNAEILKRKFDHLQSSTLLLALAVPPWVIFLIAKGLKDGPPSFGG